MYDQILAVDVLASSNPCPFCGSLPRYFEKDSTFADVDEDEDDYDEAASFRMTESPEKCLSEVEDGKIELPTYAVFCLNCQARGPVKKDRNEAIYYWNNKN